MARDYGRVKSAYWDSEAIKRCSPAAKMLGLYLLTCSHTNAIGCFRLPVPYMADDTGLDTPEIEGALAELRHAGFMQWCERMPFVWLPNFLKHNPPENPNVWRKCVKELASLPGGISAIGTIAVELIEIASEPRMRKPGSQNRVSDEEINALERYRNRSETVSQGQRPYPYPCPSPIPIPDPIPEPNQDTSSLRSEVRAREAEAPASKPERTPRKRSRSGLPDECPNDADKSWAADFWRQKGRVDLIASLIDQSEQFRDYHTKEGTLSADWSASWRTWVRRAVDFTSKDKPHGRHPQQQGRGIREAAEHALAALERNPSETQTRGAGQSPGLAHRADASEPGPAGNATRDHRASGDPGTDLSGDDDDRRTQRALSVVRDGFGAASGMADRERVQEIPNRSSQPVLSDAGPVTRPSEVA